MKPETVMGPEPLFVAPRKEGNVIRPVRGEVAANSSSLSMSSVSPISRVRMRGRILDSPIRVIPKSGSEATRISIAVLLETRVKPETSRVSLAT
jgi:hypothetical protein